MLATMAKSSTETTTLFNLLVAMKKLIYLSAAFLAVIACSREPIVSDISEGSETAKNGSFKVTLVAGNPETRTELGDDHGAVRPFWSKGDCISVITLPGSASYNEYYTFVGELEDGGRSARFSSEDGQFATFIACYPQSHKLYTDDGWNSDENGRYFFNPEIDLYSEYGYLYFNLPAVQHPGLTSFDPEADFLLSDPFDITEDDVVPETDDEGNVIGGKATIDVAFTRINALLKLKLLDQTSTNWLGNQTVRKVTFGASLPSSGGDVEEPAYAPARTRAEVWDHIDDDYSANHGLAGWIEYRFPTSEEEDGFYFGSAGIGYVTAEYTDATAYQIKNTQAATYLSTIPCILKNYEYQYWDENDNLVSFCDGLYVRVETDDYVVERNITLPEEGIALQPSRLTTLNVKLYDDGKNGTTVQRIGMTLNKESVSMKPGKSLQLEAQFAGIYPTSDELEGLVWTSSDPSVVTVEPVCYYYSGGDDLRSSNVEYTNLANVKAKTEGAATITATYQGKYVATCDVTVEVVPEQPSQMVDLGLPSGTKWAQWNLGAQSWDQEGDLYAWGETEFKSEFSWDNYKWADGKNRLTKYTMSAVYSSNNEIDNTFLLGLSDDAAYVNWGTEWYTPTTEQWTELKENCSWDYIYDDDDNPIGYTATGPNGNSISFPGNDDNTLSYMSSVLPLPDNGDVSNAIYSYMVPLIVRNSWSAEQGSHNSCDNSLYFCDRGEGSAFVRPVSGGVEMRKEPYLGAITLESSGNAIRAQFPVYESDREKDYRDNSDYVLYSVTAVILYSTDPDYEPGRYSHGHMSYDTGTSSNAQYVRFNIEDIENNKVCSFVPEGMTGTIYYRAYYYSTVKKSTYATNSIIVNEYHGVTRSITVQ